MKLLLVSEQWSVGALDLAAYFEKYSVYDQVDCVVWSELDRYRGPYDAVGYSYFLIATERADMFDCLIQRLRLLRHKFPAAELWLGGQRVRTLTPEELEQAGRECDKVVVGPGELLVNERFNELDNPLKDYPAWTEKHAQQQQGHTVEAAVVMSSRGCPHSCNFCIARDTRRVHFFAPERLVNNLRLLDKYSLRGDNPLIADDIFTLSNSHMRSVRDAMDAEGYEYRRRLRFMTRVGYHNRPEIAAFEPCEVQIGVESGDDRMLELMGKGVTVADNRAAVRELAAAVGKRVTGLFMIGYPGETSESLSNTLRFIEETRDCYYQIWVSYFSPVPGTVGMQQALEHGELQPRTRVSNRAINYVDHNLSINILQTYRAMMMKLV